MKGFIYLLALIIIFSCNSPQPVVSEGFVDSLITNYTPSRSADVNQKDLRFWEDRVMAMPGNMVNLQKYASALATRFHIYGDIGDLKKADSIMQTIVEQYKEPEAMLVLAGYKMLQHRFAEARGYIDTVIKMKAEKYAAQMMLFDASFESGDLYQASMILKKNYAPGDYAYNFRLSKQDHYTGELDSAIAHMLKAAELSRSNTYLKSAALSNTADLYVHDGNIKEAARLFEQCVRLNSCDYHSITGLGWIALVHDKNEKLANRIFNFVKEKTNSPDPLLKLYQAAELTDSSAAKKYAMQFVQEATRPAYGDMYNKYLIQLYTGILNDPTAAEGIATREITNRRTSQTYAWLAWSLFRNGRQEEAYKVYKNYVSGKSLEALELYWMGKMMKGLGKGYNAREFFTTAEKNKYDLNPQVIKDLSESL